MPSSKDEEGERERDRGRERDKDRERERDRERNRDKGRHKDQDREKSKRHEQKERHGHRSDSPKRKDKKRHRQISESEDDDSGLDLEVLGVKEITEEDYFLKSSEFKYWLKEERGKYLDEMSSEAAHRFFRKFVRRWNDGALPEKCYQPQISTAVPSSSNTAYKWTFAKNKSRVDQTQLAQARADVNRLTHSSTTAAQPETSTGPSASTSIGPSLPPTLSATYKPQTESDRQLHLESIRENELYDRKLERKHQVAKMEDIVPREREGREGKIDEKRATNQVNRELRDSKGEGLAVEVDEKTLLGDGGGFKAALAARNAAQARREERKALQNADKRAQDEVRLSDRRAKEASTMEMFKAMAKERFG